MVVGGRWFGDVSVIGGWTLFVGCRDSGMGTDSTLESSSFEVGNRVRR